MFFLLDQTRTHHVNFFLSENECIGMWRERLANAFTVERLFDTYIAWTMVCTGSGLIVGAYDGIQTMRKYPKTSNKFRESTTGTGFLLGVFTPPLFIGGMASGAVKCAVKRFLYQKAINFFCKMCLWFKVYKLTIAASTGTGLIYGAHHGLQNVKEYRSRYNPCIELTMSPLFGAMCGFGIGVASPILFIGGMTSGIVYCASKKQ